MGKNTHRDTVLEEIQKKLNKAPHNWAEMVAERMGRSEVSIYAYANGSRGQRRGYHIEVLKHLNEIVAEKELEIKKVLENGN